MITDDCQRTDGTGRIRRVPSNGTIITSEYEVHAATSPAVVKAFIRENHYEGTTSSTAHPFELHRKGRLVGGALFGPPASTNAHKKVFPKLAYDEAVTLGRLVLLDEVPGNGETWFVARCFEKLCERGIVAVESCADPWPRTDIEGKQSFRGHIGTVYQSLSSAGENARFIGFTNDSTKRLLPDGRVFSNRASGKVVQADVGRDYAEHQLVRWGADPLKPGEDPLAWIRFWRTRLTRPMRHRGNYRYLWCLNKRRKKDVLIAPALPYPKFDGWDGVKSC